MFAIRIFRQLIALTIIMVLVELPPDALAAGGSWSGSTPDNGMGQNV